MKLAFTSHINEDRTHGISSMSIQIIRLETKLRAKVNGVPVYEKFGDTILYECQCNRTRNSGYWYGGHFKSDFQSPEGFKSAITLIRKITKDVAFHSSNSSNVLQAIAAHCNHVVYDSRVQGYVETHCFDQLRDMKAWLDRGGSSGGCCTVHAYTPYANPSKDLIRKVLKRAFCEGGYADEMIAWGATGYEYDEIKSLGYDQVGWTFDRFFWFPKTFNLSVDHTTAQAEEVA